MSIMGTIEVKRICHVTSLHSAYDARIYLKQCRSLAKMNYSVYIVAPNTDDNVVDGISIVGVRLKNRCRIFRIIDFRHIYNSALNIDADVYHIHDPELLPYALKLKKKGKKVIFDSHEDMPFLIKEKKWLPKWSRLIISYLYSCYESYVLKRIDAVVSVTPLMTERLKLINSNTVEITNYPLQDDKFIDNRKWGDSICFAGGISPQWMHENIIDSLSQTSGIQYEIAGLADDNYLEQLKQISGWRNVNYRGGIDHSLVFGFIQESSVGMALNDYCANVGYKMGSLGNTKLFEYMRAGIPVICTDFTLWSKIIKENDCGICVNPHNIDEIVNAIKLLFSDRENAIAIGNNGRKSFENYYNWGTQEPILLEMYESIMKK